MVLSLMVMWMSQLLFRVFAYKWMFAFLMMLLLQGKIFTCHFTVESQPHQPSLLYHTTRYRKEFPYYANIPDTHSNTIGAIHSVDGYTVKILCRSRRQVLEFPMSSLTYSSHFIVTKAFMLALILKEEMVWTEASQEPLFCASRILFEVIKMATVDTSTLPS